jgi:hypothetical protein
LDRRLPDLKPWHVHDLRRSFASGLGDLGARPHVIESLLNHQTFKRGVSGVYNRSVYENEKRVALNMWSDHIAALTGGEWKVIPISAHDKA